MTYSFRHSNLGRTLAYWHTKRLMALLRDSLKICLLDQKRRDSAGHARSAIRLPHV